MYTRLKDLREDANLTLEQCAKKANVAKNTYIRYENGEREPKFNFIIRLAKYYNVSIDYLAGIITVPRTLDGSPYTIKNMTQINGSNNKVTIIKGNNNKINIKNT